jgi:cytochrome c oxidase assembly protein subunit 11
VLLSDQTKKNNYRLMFKLVVIAFLMLGFGYALVPFYRVICEVTGINQLTNPDKTVSQFVSGKVDRSRQVQILMSDYVLPSLVQIKPKQKHVNVHPGELMTVVYEMTNLSSRRLVGQALPSYAPSSADQFFQKLECFCFKQQSLEPNQIKEFPVIFVVPTNVPKDMVDIALSYRFFETETTVQK